MASVAITIVLGTNPRKTLMVVLTCAIILSIVAALYPLATNPTSITAAYDSAGIFAPLVFIVLVMIAPTTGSIVGLSGGAYFGLWQGGFLLFLGNLIGVCITFFLVRRFGRPAAERFINPSKLAQTDRFVGSHPFLLWLIYATPIFPLELMTAVIALADRSFKRFFMTAVLALPVYAILVTIIGNSLGQEYKIFFEYASMVIVFVMAFVILIFVYHWQHEVIHATGRKLQVAAFESVEQMQGRVEKQVKRIKQATQRRKPVTPEKNKSVRNNPSKKR